MAENSKIGWTHHTMNPWMGCTKISDGCKNCYAEELMDHRYKKTKWGPKGLRVIKAENGWKEPLSWDRKAKAAGERHRVFCASLADVFEAPNTMPAESVASVQAALWRLLKLTRATPNLDWLFLTKRPDYALEAICQASRTVPGNDGTQDEDIFWATDWVCGKRVPENIWIGTSIENQEAADLRIPHLYKVPCALRFLSCEPLLGPINLNIEAVDWTIVGCESGAHAREMKFEWAASIAAQCLNAGVPFFMKQMMVDGKLESETDRFPESLRIQQIPKPVIEV